MRWLFFSCASLTAVIALACSGDGDSHSSGGEADCAGLIADVDAFLIEQMHRFDGVRPTDQPPLMQTFGWGSDQSIPPDDLNPPPACGSGPSAPTPIYQMKYRGDVYDQSLAALWFAERARVEYAAGHASAGDENLELAQKLLDALIFLANHDPSSQWRLRAAYWANNLLDEDEEEASVMAPDAGVGNIAYFGLALTRFFHVADTVGFAVENNYPGAPTRGDYLEVAETAADWIIENTQDNNDPGGFTGGYSDWDQTPFTWKSTEHNIDVYALARSLFVLRGDEKWLSMAEHAADFVKAMYLDVDEFTGYYRTGTLDDGTTPNPSPIPADAQAWTALARNATFKIDSQHRAVKAMRWLVDNLKEGCGCETTPDDGVKFSDVGKEMQSEETGSVALALLWLGQKTEQADDFLSVLDWLRRNPPRTDDGVTDSAIAATPCLAGAWTGYGEDAWYYNLQHGASSVWSGFACLYREGDVWANPLMPLPCCPSDS